MLFPKFALLLMTAGIMASCAPLLPASPFNIHMNSLHGMPGSQTASECPAFPPVTSLILGDIYSDARGSIPNEAMVQKNKEQTDKVDGFLRFIEQALDHSGVRRDDAGAKCAYENFGQWARAGALTVEPKPYNREGAAKRGEYLIGLDVVALKFKAAGFSLDRETMEWLHKLNDENLKSYERASNRGNLRIWAAAAAALDALLEKNPEALSFQDQVWHEAMAAIHGDGTIDAEMARAHRALIYHMFSFSATLMLRSAREALGYTESPADKGRLKLLADMIGRTLCDPKRIEAAASAVQEIPGDWAYRIPIGFGSDLLSADWSHCGQPHAGLSDPSSGGDPRHTAEILERFRSH